jgi:hypothetical protein
VLCGSGLTRKVLETGSCGWSPELEELLSSIEAKDTSYWLDVKVTEKEQNAPRLNHSEFAGGASSKSAKTLRAVSKNERWILFDGLRAASRRHSQIRYSASSSAGGL